MDATSVNADVALAARTVGFIEAQLDEPGECRLDVDGLAAHAGYSRYHFTRLFTNQVGIAPGRYLAAARFRRAKQYLLAGDDPIVDVCTRVGFASLSTFTRQFTAAVGTTPAALRRVAHALADDTLQPFALLPDGSEGVSVRLSLPEEPLRCQRLVWIGWFARPVPIGLPRAGRLLAATDSVFLPLCPGAPWLLAFAVDPNAEAVDHLAPQAPLVAVHRAPLTRPCTVTLTFAAAAPPNVPLLSALPTLAPGIAPGR